MKNTLEFNQYTEVAYNTARNEKPVYKNFAASKMSNGRKTMCVVEFIDMFGKTHRIVCSNRKQMSEAQSFLSMFKTESAKVKNILKEYPVKLGRIPKKYLPELRSELKELGLTYSFINKLAGY